MRSRDDIDTQLLASLAQETAAPETAELASALIERHYGLAGTVVPLTGERDSNFHLRSPAGEFVFKIFGPGSPAEEPDLLSQVLQHVARRAPTIPVPRLRATTAGTEFVRFSDQADRARFAMLYTYLPGQPLMECERRQDHRATCGVLLARLGIALRDFSHPFMRRPLIWDLRHLPVLRHLVPTIADLPSKTFIVPFLDDYANTVVGPLAQLPHQFVHNDLNARNVIIDTESPGNPAGVIDFGDAIYTARLCDVAVGVIGQLASAETASDSMRDFIEAYQAISPLSEDEISLLPWIVAGRIVQNVIITSYYRSTTDASGHFSAFGADYFRWRIEFAEQLVRFGLPVS